jgi:putative transposase
MSRLGSCWDNACSETLFVALKVKRLDGQRLKTRRTAKDATIAWLLWYNRTRLHSTLDYVSSEQYEQNWLANQPRKANSRTLLWDMDFRAASNCAVRNDRPPP